MKTYPLELLFSAILSPFEQFVRRATAGGIVLIGATLLALLLAHSPWGPAFTHFWEQPVGIAVGSVWAVHKTIHGWVNDGLMVLFFLLVGLELKREMLVGELSSIKDAALPIVAAFGGMLCPALIYWSFNPGFPASAGWAIPTATDIAFAIGILVLLAWRIPKNLILFLTALAIADDLGAILVIAIFYTKTLNFSALAAAGVFLSVLILLNRGGIRHPIPYWALGLFLWYAVMASGIHATIAGVLLAFTIPARPAYSPKQFDRRISDLREAFRAEADKEETLNDPLGNQRLATIAQNMEQVSEAVQSPLQRSEHNLNPWVTFLILPIFALANAGIDFRDIEFGESLRAPVTLGVLLGLVLGKFVGISLFSWVGVKSGFARLPSGVHWRHLLGAAWLGGIGFTMALFISQLAFTDVMLIKEAKLGILLASLIAALIGLSWLYFAEKPATRRMEGDHGAVQ